MDPSLLLTTSLRENPSGPAIARVMSAGLDAVDPEAAVRRFLKRDGARLEIGAASSGGSSRIYDLDSYQGIWIVGAGKAGYPMALAAADILAGRVSGGLVITKDGHTPTQSLPGEVFFRETGHPLPDKRGVRAAEEMARLLLDRSAADLVICLISGGGSALMPLPAAGISLSDLQTTTSALLACGASIDQINTVRKHLDRLKGGGLARLVFPASLVTLVLSDVVGDPLDVIASGPAVPDPSTFANALEILDHFGLLPSLPASVRVRLEQGAAGQIPETPKPGDLVFEKVQTLIVSSNIQAAQAALRQAKQEGFHTLLLTTRLQGEARQAGRFLAGLARQVCDSGDPIPRPACIIAGGETTVTLTGSGRGGRNQELALGAVADLSGLEGVFLVALATDGGDGPTDAAGAVATGLSLARAACLGLQPRFHLANNDSYPFFDALGDLLKPGPTRTNVNDLYMLFIL